MKTVLCYGDSITWGFNPADGTRLSFDLRLRKLGFAIAEAVNSP